MDHKAIKVIEGVCNDFDGNGIFSIGATSALRAMSYHWKDHLAEGHNPKIISEDIDEMKNQLEAMRAEIMRRLAEAGGPEAGNGRENIYGSKLWVGNVGVALENIGEGCDGDYNPDDPSDKPLLRLDFMMTDEDGSFLESDGSGCTQVDARSSEYARQRFLRMAMAYAQKHVVNGDRSFKRLVGALTWKDENWDGQLQGYETPEEIQNQKPGNKYELTLRGFDGGSDATDDRIIAVSSSLAEGALREFLDGLAPQVVQINELPATYDAIDFQLPEDIRALRARIEAVLPA